MKQDVRWMQCFQNYRRALARLTKAEDVSRKRRLSHLEKLGVVHMLTFTHERAWNVLKEYLEEQGYANIIGPKDATRLAFKNGLVEDGEAWMDMINTRNLTSQTYKLEVVERIVREVLGRFHPAFVAVEKHFAKLEKEAA